MPKINPTSGQVSDSSQGVSAEDVNALIGEQEEGRGDALSGAENSIVEDATGRAKYPDALLSEDRGSNVISDKEAGYNQAAYDGEVDSADDPAEDARFDEMIKGKSPKEMFDLMKTADEDYTAYGVQGAMEKQGWKFWDGMGDLKNAKPPEGVEYTPPPEVKPGSRGPASVLDKLIPSAAAADEPPPKGALQIKALREEGVPETEIDDWRKERETVLLQEGISQEDIDDYFGTPPHDPKPMSKFVEKQVKTWFPPMALPGEEKKEPTKKELTIIQEAKEFWESMKKGARNSATGELATGSESQNHIGPGASTAQILGQGLGQVAGDLPVALPAQAAGTAAAIALAGGAAAVASLPVAAAAGVAATAAGVGMFTAGAVPGAIRAFYADQAQKGNYKNATDFAERMFGVLSAATSEGVVNVATLGASRYGAKVVAPVAGKVANKIGKAAITQAGALTAEFGTMATAPAALALRLPEPEEVRHAAIQLAGFKVLQFAGEGGVKKVADAAEVMKMHKLAEPSVMAMDAKLWNIYKKTGLEHKAVLEMASKDAQLHAELISDSKDIPNSLRHLDPDYVPPKTEATADYVQMDLNPPAVEGPAMESGEFATRKIEVTENLPEILGGEPVQVEFTMPDEQIELGLKGQIDETAGKQDSGYQGTSEMKQGEFVPMKGVNEGTWFSGDKRADGEQLNLGVKEDLASGDGTQLPLLMEEGKVPSDLANHYNFEQESLGLKETKLSGEPAPISQESLKIDDGVVAMGPNDPKVSAVRPGEFTPSESAKTGPFEYRPETVATEGKKLSPKKRLDMAMRDRLEQIKNLSPSEEKALRKESEKAARTHIRSVLKDPIMRDKLVEELNAWEQRHIDATAPLMRLQRLITGAKSDREAIEAIKATDNLALLASVHRGVVGKAMQMLKTGTFEFHTFEKNGKSLHEILKKVNGDRNKALLLEEYLVAARSLDYGMMDKEHPVLPSHALDLYIEHKDGEIGKIAREIVDFNARILKYEVDAGTKSQAEYDAMLKAGEHYVPQKRIMGNNESMFAGGGTLQPKKGKKTTGSKRDIQNVYFSIAQETMAKIENAERNRIAVAALKLMEKAPELRKLMEVDAGKLEVQDDGTTALKYRDLQPGEVSAFVDGKRHIYEVPEAVAIAMKAMEPATFNIFLEPLVASAKLLRAGATLTPDFIMRNMWRDQLHAAQSAANNYGNVYIPWLSGFKGLGTYIKAQLGSGSEVYDSFQRGGGMSATQTSIDLDYVQKSLSGLQKETGFMRTAVNVIKHPIQTISVGMDLYREMTKAEVAVATARGVGKVIAAPFKPAAHVLREMAEAVEVGTRLGQFESNLNMQKRKGESKIDAELRAAYSARNVTLDFQRMGTKVQAWNALVPFYNAKIQGLSNFKKTFENNPVGALATAALFSTGTMMLWASQKDDPRWGDVPEWHKPLFDIWMLDDWQTATKTEEGMPLSREREDGTWEYNRGKIVRLPKVQDWSVFGTGFQAVADAVDQEKPEKLTTLARSLYGMIPIPSIPQAYDAWKDYTAGVNSFTGRDIISLQQEKRMTADQYGPYTSPLAKLLAQKLYELGHNDTFVPSPLKTDFLITALAGGSGRDTAGVISYALEKLGYAPENLATKDWDSLPYVRAWTIRRGEQSENITDFYDRNKKINQMLESVKFNTDAGNSERLEMYMKDPMYQVAQVMGEEAGQTQDELKKLRVDIESLHKVPDDVMSKADKLRMISELLDRRVAITTRFNSNYSKILKAAKEGTLLGGVVAEGQEEEESSDE